MFLLMLEESCWSFRSSLTWPDLIGYCLISLPLEWEGIEAAAGVQVV
jgi:hypothetical protein